MEQPTCLIPDCERGRSARGWCRKHYLRWQRNGDPLAVRKRGPKSAVTACSVSGCDRPHYGRGLCGMHHKRWARHGDPLVVRLFIGQGTPDERFRAKIDENGPVPPLHPELGPCHIWTGARSAPAPYGVFTVDSRLVYAHRFAVERVDGPIPEGMEPDHLCEVVWCVRRDHLEVVTHTENMRRRFERERARAALWAAPTGRRAVGGWWMT